jgi:hypothetical protein
MSMATRPNLVGHLEHHTPTTDGSFSICVANGQGVFISQALLESIPSEHRPALNMTLAGQKVETLTVGNLQSIGTTLIPFILTNKDTCEKFRIVLSAIVLPNLFMGMFIGANGGDIVRTTQWGHNGVVFGFSFGEPDVVVKVQGI